MTKTLEQLISEVKQDMSIALLLFDDAVPIVLNPRLTPGFRKSKT